MVEWGEVWWGPTLHKETTAYRPWLILSTDTHPFSEEECIGVAMTTRDRPEGIEVPDSAWVEGGSRKQAYVSPWYATTMKHATFDQQQGILSASIVSSVAKELHSYTPASPDR